MSQLPAIEALDCEGEPASIGIRWEKWKRGLELYLTAANVTAAESKKATLLHVGGLALQEIYFNIPDTFVEGDDAFTSTVKKLDSYFSPKQSSIFERHLFRLIRQETGEKFDKFLVRLRHQCSKCKFTAPEEHMIDQITEKCESVELRKKILTIGDEVTLDKIISEANTLETVHRQLNNFDFVGQKANNDLSINRVLTAKKKTNPLLCTRCGGNHSSDSKNCPALEKKCLKCGFVGHYRMHCRTRASKRKAGDAPTKSFRPEKKYKPKPAEEVDYIFHLDGDDSIKCVLGGVEIDMLIDSGSKCNIISDLTWEMLKSKSICAKNQVKCPDKKFMAYGSQQPLDVLGSFDSSILVSSGPREETATFYVVKNGTRNLLGKDTATKLGVLRVGLGVNAVNGMFPKIKNVRIHIPIDSSVKPVSQPCRRVPIPLEAKINRKIQELIDTDIIEPVNGPSDWISPLVPVLKGDGDVRICVDMRQANQAIVREKHPLPTMEQLMPKFRNAKLFSKLDLKNSFHQLELSEDSRHITTFICSRGLFRYKRLMFGISCAPECFQKNLERILLPCEGVVNFIDDIVVFGSHEAEHDRRLEKVLQILKENYVLLNDAKCVFKVKQIEFLGHKLSCDGVKPLDKYVKTIESFREPIVIEEVQSFLGLVNYVGKWIPNLATWTEPLRELLKLKLGKGADITSYWHDKQSKAFSSLKRAMTQIRSLGYYDPEDRTQVFADASPVGLGAVLVQHGASGPRIIAFGNKSLTDREKRYCQTEKEALALVWAVEHFNMYLFGKDSFELVSDHKPLEVIFGTNSKPCARIERWVLRLQSYNFKIVFSPGKKNIADSLSRLSSETRLPCPFDDENYVNLVIDQARPMAIPLNVLKQACEEDPELKLVRNGVYHSDWDQSVTSYKIFEQELCFQDNLLLRGNKIVIPSSLRSKVLAAAHEGHPGIVAMKTRLRSKVWWPKIDKEAEHYVRACKGCTLVSGPNPPNPMRRRVLPVQPWIDVAIDFLGPLPSGHYLFVIIDYFSRYKEVKITKTIDATYTVNTLKEIFSRLGAPVSITADNGRQFTSTVFANFCHEFGIRLFHSIPYWPQQNGEVERQNRSILKRLRISQIEKSNWQDELLKYLTMYNSTPHSVTGKSPAELFFRRQFRDKLPSVVDVEFSGEDLETRDKDAERKEKGKEYSDRKRHATESNIDAGEKVYVKNMIKENKLTANFNDATHTVINKQGNDIVLENDENGQRVRRNIVHLKRVEGQWKVQSPVLVVELSLNRLEGTQLRALGLLSVFGFNVTYAVRAPADEPGPPSCSAVECRLLGHCYATLSHREFYCSCFEGYSGADCGVGPLCPRTSNMCKNGGTCRQMGPAAVSCICAPGYTGDLCEAQIAEPECGIEECSEGCKDGTSCDCNPKDTDFSTARFETRLQIVDQAHVNISQEIVKQITSYLRASNITLEDEIEVLNLSSPDMNGARTVSLRVWGARREAGVLRAALARLAATRSRADKLRLLPATLHFDMQPALSLQALVVNQRPEVWEGSEFILSCMAYGSPDISFSWYKDGVKVNFGGTTRDIWTRTVAEDALGRRMSVLGISEAQRPDSGKWSCSADDAGRRRCRALRLAVLRPPDIRLVPSTLTVNKGDNVSITCLAGAGRVHGALGFSWARERTLLPLAPGREVWEDLIPAGSVLKLYNVQKSGEFRCQVSSVAGSIAKGVTMWALGPNDEACEAGASHGLRWPRTAPGAHASAACPPGHTGETTRFCESKTGQHGVKWKLPDFSGCIADSLKDIYEQFSRISYGYSWGNVSSVARQYGSVLRSLPVHPGEGSIPLLHTRNMLHYLLSSVGKPRDRYESAEHLLKIYDTLLKHPDAFLDEEKVYELQKAVVESASLRSNVDLRLQEITVKTKPVLEDHAAHFNLLPSTGSEEWQLASVGVELVARTGNTSVVVVQYHNLAARLPSLRRSIEFNTSCCRSGRELEFALASPQAQLAAAGAGLDDALPHTVTLLYTHVRNYSAVASKLACGARTVSEPRAWGTRACEVRVPEPTHVACRCRGLGTYALFTIARSTLTDVEKDLRGVVKVTVSLSGAMCLAAAALQLLSLVPGRKAKLPVLLKAATAGTHSAAMLALLECDTRQEEACPGALGWVCAACWCAGCAALCAQPLLLQAELAGRAQRAPSVGLLAGVCTLSWLTARLWGGAPLQLGSAAQAVCACGCVLLSLLCLALAATAAARLRTITHKVPAERRNYLKDRCRLIRHTLVLLVTTSAAQAAGVAYAQAGERRVAHVAALSAAALANGITMVVCYVIRDEQCLRSARRVLSLSPHRDWQDSPAGDTSLSLYIKQGGEVESRGGVGMLESTSSPVSPVTSYWRAPGLESPTRIPRRLSTPDSRADIVRCVEYKDSTLSPHLYGSRRVTTTHAVCDLIPHAPHNDRAPPHPEYMARVCLELGVLNTPPHESPAPLLTCSVDFEPYSEKFETTKENCAICVQSNPDISKIPSPPIKSCLKKTKSFSSSTSLPSMETQEEPKTKSDIEQVNREWNKAYDSPETDRMLNKISNDLDFLLNRTQEGSKIPDQIEEAPT